MGLKIIGVSCSPRKGKSTRFALDAAMLIQDMIVVGDGFDTFHFGGTVWSGHPGGYENDGTGIASARNLGKRVAEVASWIHR